MSSHRYILPASKGPQSSDSRQESSSRGTSSGPSASASSQPKRNAIKSACASCRRRKSKCDGGRPTCSACAEKGISNCYYDVEEGQTRTTSLKQQIQDLKDIISGLSLATDKNVVRAIVSQLQSSGFRNLEDVASHLRTSTLTTISSATGSYQSSIGPSEPSLEFAPTEDSLDPEQTISMAKYVYAHPVQTVKKIGSRSRIKMEPERTRERYWFEPLRTVKELEVLAMNSTTKGVPIHGINIANEADDRYLSTRYTDFIEMKRGLIRDGYDPSEVLGPATMDPRRLLDEDPTPRGESEPVWHWATGMVKQFDKMCVAERLAYIILVSALARWQIYPTLENYNEIPECMKPTPTQTMVLHPAWIDYIPWPEIRDYFIKSPPFDTQPDDPLILITQHTHINWDENHDSMVQIDPIKNSFFIDEEFERYGRDINNWSLDHAVATAFPEIAAKAWIKEHIHARDASFVEEDMQAFRALIYEHDPTLTEEGTTSR